MLVSRVLHENMVDLNIDVLTVNCHYLFFYLNNPQGSSLKVF